MKKQEIKKDIIRDRIINILNYISENTNVVWGSIGAVIILISAITFFSNKNKNQLSESNLSIALIQHKAMSNEDIEDSSILQDYKNILDNPIAKHDYNQAFIYLLSDAIKNDKKDYILDLLSNNNFSSDDDMLNSFLNISKAIYLYSEDMDNCSKYYKKAIKSVPSYDLKVSWASDLINMYLDKSDYKKANSVLLFLKDLIDDDDSLPPSAKNDLKFIESKIEQLK